MFFFLEKHQAIPLLIRGIKFLFFKENIPMMQIPETFAKNENIEGFKIVPAIIMVFLMMLFVAATIYVLISSLL